MTGTLLLLLLWGLGDGEHGAASCPPERLSHAKKAYAPLPYLRDLTPSCGRIGTPTLRLEIDSKGQVGKPLFLKSTGCKAADERLRQCLRYWRYEPATCAGKPVPEILTLTINWHPEERKGEEACRPESPCEKKDSE
jgi:hypothetical protein